MGRGPGRATMVRAMVEVPVRGVAGATLSSTMTAYTVSGRLVASLWGLFVCLSATSLLAQPCEMIVSTASIALLTFSWALGLGMRVTTLLAVMLGGYG